MLGFRPIFPNAMGFPYGHWLLKNPDVPLIFKDKNDEYRIAYVAEGAVHYTSAYSSWSFAFEALEGFINRNKEDDAANEKLHRCKTVECCEPDPNDGRMTP